MEPDFHVLVMAVASFVGSVAFALSGFLVGARKKLDVMGIFIVAFLTANGGGVIRDVLVGRAPAVLQNTQPFWLVAGVVAIAVLCRLQRFAGLERSRVFVLSDSVGLVAFGITGAIIGIEEQLHVFGVLVLSLLTATGGGIVRDLLVNEVPLVLHGDFYGSVALLLGAAIYVLHLLGWMHPASLMVVAAAGLVLRLIAYQREWQLPKVD